MKFSRKVIKLIYRVSTLIIVGILVILLLNFYKANVKNFFYRISEPIQKVFWRAGNKVSDFFETISEIRNLKKENEELKLKNQELLAQIALLEELKKENERLREALNIGLEKEFTIVLAQVIGKDISQDFILINKGSEDGISENLPVITQQKILLGKISEVYKNYSKVILISNKESSFDGKILEKETLGQVLGKGDFEVLFDLISPEQEITEGDLVETSALGGTFPKGLLVGQIREVKRSDIQPFYQAEISPFFDLGKLEMVFIILDF